MNKKGTLFITYNLLYTFAKRARYKQIEENYFHFLFQGYRIECTYSEEEFITCICKISSPKLSNKLKEKQLQIIYMCNDNSSLIFNENLFNKFYINFIKYVRKNKNWERKDGNTFSYIHSSKKG